MEHASHDGQDAESDDELNDERPRTTPTNDEQYGDESTDDAKYDAESTIHATV